MWYRSIPQMAYLCCCLGVANGCERRRAIQAWCTTLAYLPRLGSMSTAEPRVECTSTSEGGSTPMTAENPQRQTDILAYLAGKNFRECPVCAQPFSLYAKESGFVVGREYSILFTHTRMRTRTRVMLITVLCQLCV